MTITYLELAGDWEEFDVVLANLLTEEWDDSNTNSKTPEIKHSGNSATNRRAGPTRKKHTDQIRLKITGERNDTENSDSSRTHNRKATLLEIKIETDNNVKAGMYKREIDRILSEAHPNSGTRILKVDNTNSPILYFDPVTPDWTVNIPDVVNTGIVLYSGLLSLEWAMERS